MADSAAPRPPGTAGSAAWRPLGVLAAAVAAVLVATSGRYGYSRDELYFLRAGQEAAFGYVDQPPLTPLVARLATALFGDSLVGLRLVPALAAALVVVLTGLLARELGARPRAQLLAAACMAVSTFLAAVGHLLTTSTLDLLAWTGVSLLVVRALRGSPASWVLAGAAAGVGLQNKVLVAALLAALGLGLLLAGPREVLRTPAPWWGAAVALLLWSPYLVWQAAHGWPQLEVSEAIAGGSSGTSEPRALFLPFQLVLVSPVLVPVWVAGLWRLARSPELRRVRAFAVAYVLLAVLFLVTGGKPYYLCGLYPVLLAAGAEPALQWAQRSAGRLRAGLLVAALALSAVVSAVLFLPVVPVEHLAATPVVDVNYDAGETVGWPALARTVAGVHAALPPSERAGAVLLARNYGQAGALDRYGPGLGLPRVYSGHNAYAAWGPPPERAATAVVVGHEAAELRRWFGSVELAARVDNGVGLDNDEQGAPVWVCRDRRASWEELWPQLRRVG